MIKNKQLGVGLIEVLATLLILSIGMLGIASLQATGIQAGQGASLRTSALIVVEDIVSRMKANKIGVYNIPAAVSSYNTTVADAGANNGCSDAIGGTVAVLCNPANMARHDVFLWKTSLNNLLPTGTGQITTVVMPPLANGLVNITVIVTWQEKGVTKSYETVIAMVTQ